jgi:hypothetical protein
VVSSHSHQELSFIDVDPPSRHPKPQKRKRIFNMMVRTFVLMPMNCPIDYDNWANSQGICWKVGECFSEGGPQRRPSRKADPLSIEAKSGSMCCVERCSKNKYHAKDYIWLLIQPPEIIGTEDLQTKIALGAQIQCPWNIWDQGLAGDRNTLICCTAKTWKVLMSRRMR